MVTERQQTAAAVEALGRIAQAVVQNAPCLSEMDAALGDGDHGAAMAKAFRAVEVALPDLEGRPLEEVLGALGKKNASGQRLKYVLVYCAPGEHRSALSGLSDLGLRCHEFVHSVSLADREKVLAQFERGSIETLVAIRCLDEGVDVPATRLAFFLASTMNPRQFIQRRGRVLRLADGKERAILYDLLVVPSSGEGTSSREAARSLLRREMPRFAEFASAATNRFAAREVVFDLLNEYGMLHLLEETPWEIYKRELSGEAVATLADDPIIGGDLNV